MIGLELLYGNYVVTLAKVDEGTYGLTKHKNLWQLHPLQPLNPFFETDGMGVSQLSAGFFVGYGKFMAHQSDEKRVERRTRL